MYAVTSSSARIRAYGSSRTVSSSSSRGSLSLDDHVRLAMLEPAPQLRSVHFWMELDAETSPHRERLDGDVVLGQ